MWLWPYNLKDMGHLHAFILLLLIHSLRVFCISISWWSWWSLSDSKFLQVSRTFLTDLNNAVVCMVSFLPLISNSSNHFSKSLGRTVPCVPTTIGITIIFMFHSFFGYLAKSKYLSIFSLFFIFTSWSIGTAKSARWQLIINDGDNTVITIWLKLQNNSKLKKKKWFSFI